eukprot:TRINITY_DN1636_c0_g2_i1.p2 TRINITY_DN1636_c0_g2~~TRINITY_DN1636_c0_g2_i1.p2  ORF type:complete len:124 (+),score=26.49 TRINITY_DN1636_c0_g2_i1:111-482(+)
MKIKLFLFFFSASLFLLASANNDLLEVVSGASRDPGGLAQFVNGFKEKLGSKDNGVGGTFKGGFRSINWDAVPKQFSFPNRLPPDFFNKNSPRGIIFVEDREKGDGFAVSNNDKDGKKTFWRH